MITEACGFIQFDTEEDFYNNVTKVDEWFRFHHSILQRPDRFPAVYQYHEPWDAHFCGHWALCENNTQMLEALTSKIENLQKLRERIAKPVDSKQHL